MRTLDSREVLCTYLVVIRSMNLVYWPFMACCMQINEWYAFFINFHSERDSLDRDVVELKKSNTLLDAALKAKSDSLIDLQKEVHVYRSRVPYSWYIFPPCNLVKPWIWHPSKINIKPQVITHHVQYSPLVQVVKSKTQVVWVVVRLVQVVNVIRLSEIRNSRYQLRQPDDKQDGRRSICHIAFDMFTWAYMPLNSLGKGANLLLSHMGHHISRIKSSFELSCAWDLANF